MRVTAAVLYDTKKPVVVEDVELLEPGPHEVQVRWTANGVCHSDLHVITGDSPHPLPVQALLSTHRGGTCVVVGVSPAGTRVSVDPSLLLQQRVLTGSSFGAGHQRTDVPMLIDLYMTGKYRLDELISRRLPLGDLNHAFDLMLQGEVKRSVIVYP